MPSYTWDFSVLLTYKIALLHGLELTLGLTAVSLIAGTALGLLLCLAKISRNKGLRVPAAILIEAFTGLPLLVLMVWLFYALPIFTSIQLGAFVTATIALSLNLSGFAAEIFRAGIQAIPKGQTEAALALGLTRLQTLQRIILPQAITVILPPLSGRYIETIKLSSLASVIAVDELLHAGQNLIGVTFRPLEVYTAIALIYLAIILPLTFFLRRMENRH